MKYAAIAFTLIDGAANGNTIYGNGYSGGNGGWATATAMGTSIGG